MFAKKQMDNNYNELDGLLGKPNHVRFKGSVNAGSFEKALYNFYSKCDDNEPLLLDFSQVDYIEIATLSNCVAYLSQRSSFDFKTFIKVPTKKTIRDFLNNWRFPEAVQDVSKTPFYQYLAEEEFPFLDEPQTTYKGIGDGIDELEFDPDWNHKSLDKRNFFEFSTLKLNNFQLIKPDGPFATVPRSESKRWTSPLIKQVLNKHLENRSNEDDIARVIIYEAMSNAVRHPKARNIQIVSRFDSSARVPGTSHSFRSKHSEITSQQKSETGNFRICIWDDGESIADTLLALVRSGKSVRSFNLPSFMNEKIHVKIKKFGTTKSRDIVIDQSENPGSESATEPRMLLMSLFPGISRTVEESTPDVLPFNEQSNLKSSNDLSRLLRTSPGMGLYSLVRTVIDQYQGKLFIRSGHQNLSIEVAHDAYRKQFNCRYKCKIKSYPQNFPKFNGNLITIQLPIK